MYLILYITGSDGPDPVAISSEGNILWRSQIDKGICYYCHGKFPPEELSMDHIVPVARGGRSVRGNVVPCCKECNNRKKYLTPAEIIMEQMEREEKEKEKTRDIS